MRTIIYGAGAIGGVIGGSLARSGQDVILICRPHQTKAINENGLKLVTPAGASIIKVQAVASPAEIKFNRDDVVFLSVKGQNTEEAMSDLKKVVSDVPVFCFQNGVRNEETVSRYFKRVYGVMIRLMAVYLKDGEVMARRDPPGWFVMGCYPKGKDTFVENVAKGLRGSGFYVLLTDDIMPYKWDKLIRNLANSVGAIANTRSKEVDCINEAMRSEAMNLMKEAGIRWVTDEELAKQWPDINAPARGTLDVEAQSSTWQSLARGQSVETDYLNGEIVSLAQKLGKKAPINEGLLNICKEMAEKHEKPGKYTPAQLATLLGIRL